MRRRREAITSAPPRPKKRRPSVAPLVDGLALQPLEEAVLDALDSSLPEPDSLVFEPDSLLLELDPLLFDSDPLPLPLPGRQRLQDVWVEPHGPLEPPSHW